MTEQQWTPEQMREQCRGVIEGVVNREQDVQQIMLAVIYKDGSTRVQFVADLPGHSLLMGMQQAQYLDRMRKAMAL